VTVRMRGVMEKCTFCVQRIQGAKAAAKAEGRALADGGVQPACVQSCPTRALVFGDANDPDSALSRARKDRRFFRVLGELDVKPSVGYLATLRNREARHE
jgi:Fe-S-cluster-containing dehydrogenase component